MKMKFIRNCIGLFLVGFLLSCANCFGCDDQDNIFTITIYNTSTKPLVIKSYTDKVLQKSINLEIDETYSQEFHSILGAGINSRKIFEANQGLPIDSLIIIYSNKKKTSWNSNILKTEDDYLHAIYDINTSTFILTEDDYNNAIDCNGICE